MNLRNLWMSSLLLRVFLGAALLCSAFAATFVRAQLTDAEKKKRARTREEMRATASPTPAETPEAGGNRKPKSGSRKASGEDSNEEEATPSRMGKEKAKLRESLEGAATPVAKKSPTPLAKESPVKKSTANSGKKESGEAEGEAIPKAERATPEKAIESSEATSTPAIKKSPTPNVAESGKKKKGARTSATSASKRKKKGASKKASEQTKKAKPSKTPKPEPDEESGNRKPETRPGEPSAGNRKVQGGDSSEGEEALTTKQKAGSGLSPEPTKKRAVTKGPAPEPEKSPIRKSSATEEAEPNRGANPKHVEKAEPARTPQPIEKSPKSVPELTRIPTPEPPSQARPVSSPPSPQAVLPSDITIEKSGLETEQGLEPPPPPPPRRGIWPWSRQPANYRYLTSTTIDAIRNAPVQRGRWKYIIVHNSGTRQGNARAFDYYHRKIRRMRNGLAYHFVIGNGTSSRNGQIEIGDRWRRQINGGHVHSDYMNNIGLGICLVGDFNRDQPTRAQLEACEELIKYLQERCGKSEGRSLIVRPHREVNPPRWATDCPGDGFPYNWFGRFK